MGRSWALSGAVRDCFAAVGRLLYGSPVEYPQFPELAPLSQATLDSLYEKPVSYDVNNPYKFPDDSHLLTYDPDHPKLWLDPNNCEPTRYPPTIWDFAAAMRHRAPTVVAVCPTHPLHE